MKTAKVENTNVEFRIWCEKCSIRIAESEERTVVGAKAYHVRCYEKLKTDKQKKPR